MSDPFIGQICMFGFNFAPRGWAFCDGSLLPINQNTALFSLLGTQYGGDGRTTFALPNLQGRIPMSQGSGSGLTPRTIGEIGGAESITLTTSEIPGHTHALTQPVQVAIQGEVKGSLQTGTETSPENAVNAIPAGGRPTYSPGMGDVTMQTIQAQSQIQPADFPLSQTGESQPHDNMPPYQVINFCIALEGIFPSRD